MRTSGLPPANLPAAPAPAAWGPGEGSVASSAGASRNRPGPSAGRGGGCRLCSGGPPAAQLGRSKRVLEGQGTVGAVSFTPRVKENAKPASCLSDKNRSL